ncbi:alpha/beta fold hydrolase [Zafaria sp. Z1313]|uniref:alpha/beta fold hydrolase n=1 Tax=unclassified Zafaria TaxID=2828765 RepID=UPI002E791982|nr:alpha/beta fold hydrolase [Zafaria sp. J156]MEE1620184.1 alpha/beta fold hydrolase [Zafaria sp. J156]
MSQRTTPHRIAAVHEFRGMRTTEHYFEVPLDHDDPDGGQLTLFAREVSSTEHADPGRLPWLLFLQGGPGGKGPRVSTLGGWLEEACKEFRVLLLDQRGTGLSSPATRQTLPLRGDPAAQAAYLARFRADAIVRDAELLRGLLADGPWTTFGQSYGGFCTLSYLSLAPGGLAGCLVAGGLPPLAGGPDLVYRATYARMSARNAEYFAAYPEDRAMLDRILAHVDRVEEQLPDGRPVRRHTVQMLGQFLGGNTRVDQLHHVLEGALVRTRGGESLSDAFLEALQGQASRYSNPLYALMHESIYGQGGPTAWSAARVLEEFPDFAPDAASPLLTGEMVYPWYFEEDPALRPLEQVAALLAGHGDWPALYDPERLARNTVPVAAVVYADDVYVDRELSLETAAAVRGLRVWETDEFHHDGIADDGAAVFSRLLGMIRPQEPAGDAPS